MQMMMRMMTCQLSIGVVSGFPKLRRLGTVPKVGQGSISSELCPLLLKWYADDDENDDLPIIHWRGKRISKIKTAWNRAKSRAGIYIIRTMPITFKVVCR